MEHKNKIDVAQPKEDWKTEDIATVGELILDISIQLARTWVFPPIAILIAKIDVIDLLRNA